MNWKNLSWSHLVVPHRATIAFMLAEGSETSLMEL